MSDIEFNVNYNGTRESLMERLKGLEQKAQAQYGAQAQAVQTQWRDDGLDFKGTVMGFTISTKVDVRPTRPDGGEVHVAISLPLALSLMRGPIEQKIRQEVTQLLGN